MDSLAKFCAPNHMVVNEIKTKFMVYGASEDISLHLNGNKLDQVDRYKSLGNILNSIKTTRGDMFRYNTDYLNCRARKAVFGIKQKLKHLGNIPPSHWFHIYESMIEPILIYGSDIWGASAGCTLNVDKVYLWFIRVILNIKATTPNIITMGESGIIPPRVKCHENVIIYFIRLNSMACGSVVKSVFKELKRLHTLGYSNWYTEVLLLAKYYEIEPLHLKYCQSSKKYVKNKIRNDFRLSWVNDLNNMDKYPSLRTYRLFKKEFVREPYLTLIKKSKYTVAFSQFRAGSHTLEVQRGRYNNPRTPLEERLCSICNQIEDEQHFIMQCKLYSEDRKTLFDKISKLYSPFLYLTSHDQFIFLMSNVDGQILSWIGKFIHNSMQTRALKHQSSR